MGHFVYKYVKDGEIVYIGKNDTNLISRITQHERDDKFQEMGCDIYYTEFPSSFLSEAYETLLIEKYKPELNTAKITDWKSIPFSEPKWRPLSDLEKTVKKPITDGDISVNRYITRWKSRVAKESEYYDLMVNFLIPQYISHYKETGGKFCEIKLTQKQYRAWRSHANTDVCITSWDFSPFCFQVSNVSWRYRKLLSVTDSFDRRHRLISIHGYRDVFVDECDVITLLEIWIANVKIGLMLNS